MYKTLLPALLAVTGTMGLAATASAQQPAPPAASTATPPAPTGPSPRGTNEIAQREQLNREQAEFAQRQIAENEAAKAAYERAIAEREAAIAAQAAEQQRLMREHEQAMTQWRATAEAGGRQASAAATPGISPGTE